MSDNKANAFDRALEQIDAHYCEWLRNNLVRDQIEYLTALTEKDEEIASFTVAELIEHLNRHL